VVQELGLQELGLQELGLQELGLQELGLQELGLQELGLQELGLQELGLQELGLQELGLQELGLQELGLQELAEWRGKPREQCLLQKPARPVERQSHGNGPTTSAGPGRDRRLGRLRPFRWEAEIGRSCPPR
jgi:hypothetical protein